MARVRHGTDFLLRWLRESYVQGLSQSGIYATNAPARGQRAWRPNVLQVFNDPGESHQIDAVSCARPTLCVAVGQNGPSDAVWISSTPTIADSWSVRSVSGTVDLSLISCPSSSFCLGGDLAGHVLTLIDPRRSMATQLKSTEVDPGRTLTALSCLSPSRCAAGDLAGNLLVSSGSDPASQTWSAIDHADPLRKITAVACASRSLCIATDERGRLLLGG